MHRRTGHTTLTYPAFLCLALTLFLIPESGVGALRSQVYSLLGPVLSVAAHSTHSANALPVSIEITLDSKNPSAAAQPNAAPELDRAKAELIRLRNAILRLREKLNPNDASIDDPQGIDAGVIARRVLWQEPMLGLDKGSADGVRLDAGVMHRGAVVGRVIAAPGPHASCMALLTHPAMKIGARLLESRVEGILQGQKPGDGTERFCRMTIVAKELRASVGEEVVTSGLDGTFPPGLWLGAIVKITRTADFQWELIVRPACDENRIESVHVLTGQSPEVPWPKTK